KEEVVVAKMRAQVVSLEEKLASGAQTLAGAVAALEGERKKVFDMKVEQVFDMKVELRTHASLEENLASKATQLHADLQKAVEELGTTRSAAEHVEKRLGQELHAAHFKLKESQQELHCFQRQKRQARLPPHLAATEDIFTLNSRREIPNTEIENPIEAAQRKTKRRLEASAADA
ncbi:hypothetical protein T484DRAFT_1767586, partial [Baffinella frigidus]